MGNAGSRTRTLAVSVLAASALAGLGLAAPARAGLGTAGGNLAGALRGGSATVIGAATVPPAHARDLGAAPAGQRLRVDVVLKPRHPAALTDFATAVSTPGSPLYRHYLAKGQAAEMFGAALPTVRAVRAVLSGAGLQVSASAADGLVIAVTGTVRQLDAAFHTSLHAFRLASGEVADANVTPLRLPASAASAVQGIVGLDGLASETSDLRPGSAVRGLGGIRPDQVPGEAEPCRKATGGGWTGPQIAQAYDMDPLYVHGDFGAGESVDLVEFAPFNSADIAAYQKCYRTKVPVHTIVVDSGLGRPNSEDEVDIEDLTSLAPRLDGIYVYEAPANTAHGPGSLDILTAILHADNAKVISDSWGGCETAASDAQIAQSEQPLLEMIAAQGQSFFSATGDRGSVECGTAKQPALGVQDPSSQQWVTAVGGTNLNGLGNPPAVAPSENAWVAGGGGISSLWEMPIWQSPLEPGVINPYTSAAPCNAQGTFCREVPDVSANAGIGYAMLTGPGKGRWGHPGGTSLATPTWAAVTALIDASSAHCRKSPVGLLSLALYAWAPVFPADFNDITRGNNADNDRAVHGRYPATKGYDLATGIGTPEAANLAQTLCLTPPLWSLQAIVPALAETTSPVVATSGHTVYLAATNAADNIVYATFNGTTWSSVSEVTIGNSPIVTSFSPGIAVNDGHLMIAWTSKANGDVEVSSLEHRAWTAARVVGGGKATSNHGPSLTANGGNPAVAWQGHDSDNAYLSILGSKGWSSQLKVSGARTSIRPAIVYFPPLSAYVVAWVSSKLTIQYTVLSVLGFGNVVTVSQALTNNTPALAVLGARLFVAWKGRTSDRIAYSSQPDGEAYGSWAGQLIEPEALTLGFPALAVTGPTLYTFWLGKSGKHLGYQFADPPD